MLSASILSGGCPNAQMIEVLCTIGRCFEDQNKVFHNFTNSLASTPKKV